MLFYRLYRPHGRVGTVIPRGDIFDLLDIVLPEKSTIRSEFSLSIIIWWMGLDREEKKAKYPGTNLGMHIWCGFFGG